MIEAAVSSTSSASSFAAAPSPAPDAESNDDDEASFAPASPPDEEIAAPVVTPFLGERDAAVFDVERGCQRTDVDPFPIFDSRCDWPKR